MKKFTQLLEDTYTSEYKVKKVMGPDGKWHDKKLRPHRIDFKNSKMHGEPAQKDSGEDVGMKEEKTTGATKLVHTRTGADGAKYHIMQDSPYDYSVHKEHKGKTTHIDTYSSLHRAKSVLDNEVKEETNMTIDEQINEVLSKDATAGDWIHDFVHSDNPKFADKSKDKRKEMALAAYYAKQRNEEVDLDEAAQGHTIEAQGIRGMKGTPWRKTFKSHEHLSDWADKNDSVEVHATRDLEHTNSNHAPQAPTPDRKYIKGTPENKALKASRKPINGHPTNVKEGTMKSFKEMVQSLDEKSEQAKQNKTMKNMMDASRGARYKLNNPVSPADPEHKTAQAHNKAIGRALRNEAKDESEYGYEGDMAITQLKTMCRHAEEFMGMLKPDTDLPEWVQSKITLATDYIQTAHDYMSSEMNEELKGSQHKLDKNKNGKVDSGDFKMLRGEQCPECGKAPCECGSMKEAAYSGLEKEKKMGLPTAMLKKSEKAVEGDTVEGWDHPHKAVKKEEDETRTVSFKDFINEIKMADLPKRTVKGSSYGAQYHDPEGDDAFDRKPKQVAKPEPEVKRGRGRPAGSKSGANQKVTSGTKRSGVDYSGYKLHLPNSNR